MNPLINSLMTLIFIVGAVFMSYLLSLCIPTKLVTWYNKKYDKVGDLGSSLVSVAMLTVIWALIFQSYLLGGIIGVSAVKFNEAEFELVFIGILIILLIIHGAFQFKNARLKGKSK